MAESEEELKNFLMKVKDEEKGATEDEMVEWHHQNNGHEFEQTRGDGEQLRSLVSCSPRGHRVAPDLATEQQQQFSLD